MTIRIALADDNLLVREGLRRLLELEEDFEVVAVCEDLDTLLSARELGPRKVVEAPGIEPSLGHAARCRFGPS